MSLCVLEDSHHIIVDVDCAPRSWYIFSCNPWPLRNFLVQSVYPLSLKTLLFDITALLMSEDGYLTVESTRMGSSLKLILLLLCPVHLPQI
jgi:hypothetical protein